MMSQLWPILLGAVLAIGGGYLGARWQGQQQRASILHEARINLYVDLMYDCQRRREGLMYMKPEPYETPKDMSTKVYLLASSAVKEAWRRVQVLDIEAEAAKRTGINQASDPAVRVHQQRLAALTELEARIHADVAAS
ncbi:hypothetical protein [Micromonospora antibiotica]|uniref:Uncharacterized protein n=1 Tax=Micromonospora antibiotica TaxID=2807623 RepID=A0ABS3V4Q0_9ACTN|nr:hypothetical protein [Micromonospora antibiotica]MBO4160601.1 hypothetical protein [Micromonospora antibiotica]